MIRKPYFLICSLLFIALCSCKDTTYGSSVPSYPVHLEINIQGEYPHFVPENIYSYLTFTHQRYATDAIGYAGIVVYIDGNKNYCAFDMACPVCLSQSNPVEVDGIFAHCPICGEDYDLSHGLAVPQHGAKEALRRYTAYYNGTKLIISQ